FNYFPRRIPHSVNPAARGPFPTRPVGDSVLDVPPSRSPPASPRSADPRPASDDCGRPQIARAAGGGAARKGGTPGEGSPFDPLLRFFGTGAFRALRRAARAPPLDPARFFVKKRGKKLLNASLHPAQAPRPWGE